jgi:putative two-component system response regulator
MMMKKMDRRATVLTVDDTPANIALLNELLKGDYRVRIATNGRKALEIAAAEPKPDLILLDIMMPEMDGYEVCRRLKADPTTRDVPVIFLTALTHTQDEQRGFELGAVDYITKPISPPVLQARVKTHLTLKQARDYLENQNEILEGLVAQRTRELALVQDATILSLASLAETRDPETGNHIRRTQNYVKTLAIQLKDHPRFRNFLTAEIIDLLFKSAPLHDIGKVGVPDGILKKPGKLTTEEFELMKLHTIYGRAAISAAENKLDGPMEHSFLRLAREIAYAHHEKWDGNGYPEGLSGDDIPPSARLMAVADFYDALISQRVYKPAIPHEQAIAAIRSRSGSHFDPDIVEAVLVVEDEFRTIGATFSDPAGSVAPQGIFADSQD